MWWQKLKNWFRGVFTKFEFDCFISDEEWDERFPEDAKQETGDDAEEQTEVVRQ